MPLDPSAVSRWIEPLVRSPDEIADLFVENRRETVLEWRDGQVARSRVARTEGVAARWRRGGEERLVFLSGSEEATAREALRRLQGLLSRPALPARPAAMVEAAPEEPPPVERWRRRLAALFSRHAPRHRFRWTLLEIRREVFPARAAASAHARRLLSLEGTFTAASRRGDELRAFAFHAPESEATADELKRALSRAAEPRDAPLPCPAGAVNAILAGGCAAVLFHEILSHPLEGGVVSPLSTLSAARLAAADVDAKDDATRLDLFGGYERDDEGTSPRPVKLLDSGRLAGRLTTRSSAERGGSNGHGRRGDPSDAPLARSSNVVVAPGNVPREELTRRLADGLWIEDFDGGSAELASGTFRLKFPRARRIRRSRSADELGPGILAGEILAALAGIETGLGREAHPYRALGWCSREGQILPVQGSAPDLLVRGLSVRPLS